MYEIKYRDESELKDSGFEWLGKIPRKWSVCKLNLITDVRDGTHDTPRFVDEEANTYPLITSKNISSNKLRFDDVKYISEKDYFIIGKRSGVEYGDIIMPMIGTIGNPCIVNTYEKFAIKNLALFKMNKQINNSYLFYQLESEVVKKQFAFLTRGGVQSFVSLDVLRNLKVMKTNYEQQKIANFIDIKTAQFDQIISKKEQLIERLEEAKKSLISEVITGKVKIVDGQLVERDASEMRDSGVEWLGMVPRDWNITKIKYDTYVKGRIGWQGLNSEEFTNVGPHLVTGSDFKGNQVIWEDCYRISEKRYLEAPAIQLKNGDLLVTKDGTIGKLAIVSECPEKAVLNSGIFVTRCKNKAYITKYMYYILLSKSFDFYVGLQSTGSTIKHLYQETFVNFIYILPSVETQKVLIEFLDKQTHEIEKIVRKSHKQVRKLKQAKQSLISEAVTGKIDLRNWEIIEEGEMQ